MFFTTTPVLAPPAAKEPMLMYITATTRVVYDSTEHSGATVVGLPFGPPTVVVSVFWLVLL